ncbi:hypothetical protein F8C76_10190 [Flagellimonas olearia]|uniref:Bacteriophage abortive infection AbiH n=1 Tax=Flagellimonas olearia TaxID=552546 RepID=A0A6I1DWN5_9FLAO|nr:AbiH family protein [Allomuricauda olearia]KAB7528231.1 hypothetical protein F8C76_10190 [Allomuricauda olearia]
MSEYQYNRMVIVGNGLDLALGLKTTYTDFLRWYILACLEKARDSKYSDKMVQVDRIANVNLQMLNECETFEKLIDRCKSIGHLRMTYRGFLVFILDHLQLENWVDIESLYFDTLIPLMDEIKKNPPSYRDFEVIKEALNSSFQEMSDRLGEYIFGINQAPLSQNLSLKYYDFLQKSYKKQINEDTCLNHEVGYKQLGDPEKLLFLNFNYTNSIDKLFIGNGLNKLHQSINIHGVAGSISNPIIFGYGDDTHPYYAKIEEERSNVPLEFIKSFYYNRTTDYHEMLGFMESGPFEVYIVGHSCGLSDRTLLKSIFEHRDCLSIKIFHRGTIEEHVKKNMAISRHFDNKQLLRKRVLPFDKFAVIPQVK